MSRFREGVKDALESGNSTYAGYLGYNYVRDVESEIEKLNESINNYCGTKRGIGKQKGFALEDTSAGTLNFNAVKADSPYRAEVLGSNGYGSVDVKTNFGVDVSCKAYDDPVHGFKAQAISHQEYNLEKHRDVLPSDFMAKRNIQEEDYYHALYEDMLRLNPKGQNQVSMDWLRSQVDAGKLTPEQAARYYETAVNSAEVITAPDGTESIAFTVEDLKEIARRGKEGTFDARDFGVDLSLVNMDDMIKQGIKAGNSAALMSLIVSIGPEIWKILNDEVEKGNIDEDELRTYGLDALKGSAEAYVKGFITTNVYIAGKSGLLGSSVQSCITPEITAALTLFVFNTICLSAKCAMGKISASDMAADVIQNAIVIGSGVALGLVMQSIIPFGYFLGNFVGTVIGSFIYTKASSIALSFCCDSGLTMFGLVSQDYTLPPEMLAQIGEEVGFMESAFMEVGSLEIGTLETASQETACLDSVYYLRRGVIGVRKIGYVL